ncbi:hypothetical protein [Salipiger abyssi]|uniref:hypothetical protein n=1 Tax=Salipiger abyssi TaxID=1250539 RepID=UPI001A8D4B79|nr:hypothetical protein [Salipiger abyssi]MBN9890434.1 hypothetical protein [Salipiger abyssi]
MQFTGVPPAVAPLATGHPLGLPAVPDGPARETKVQPVSEQARTGTDGETSGQPPADFWRGLTGLPNPAKHVAPPSIMQIKISAILEEQAERLTQDLRPPEPAPTGAEDDASPLPAAPTRTEPAPEPEAEPKEPDDPGTPTAPYAEAAVVAAP